MIESYAKVSFAMHEEGIDPQNRSDTSDITRREVLVTVGVLVGAVAAGAAGWGLLEVMVALRQPVESWHKSVCRFCGTGCGVLVGMKDGLTCAGTSSPTTRV